MPHKPFSGVLSPSMGNMGARAETRVRSMMQSSDFDSLRRQLLTATPHPRALHRKVALGCPGIRRGGSTRVHVTYHYISFRPRANPGPGAAVPKYMLGQLRAAVGNKKRIDEKAQTNRFPSALEGATSTDNSGNPRAQPQCLALGTRSLSTSQAARLKRPAKSTI